MRLILVRHRETFANRTEITHGSLESDLSPTGVAQARSLADRLRSEAIQAAYSSDQSRARQTAEHILRHHPTLALELRPELRERHYGVLEGKPFSAFYDALATSGTVRHDFKPEGGEHYDDVRRRLSRFHADILRRHRGQTVLVVSHSGTLGAYLLEILGEPNGSIERFRNHPNTGVTIVEYDPVGTPTLRLLKDDTHLPPELRPAA